MVPGEHLSGEEAPRPGPAERGMCVRLRGGGMSLTTARDFGSTTLRATWPPVASPDSRPVRSLTRGSNDTSHLAIETSSLVGPGLARAVLE